MQAHFIFYLRTEPNQKNKKSLQANAHDRAMTTANTTGHSTTIDNRAAYNKGFNEIYFLGADIGNQTFVHLCYICGLRKCCASNPPKNKLHKSPNR